MILWKDLQDRFSIGKLMFDMNRFDYAVFDLDGTLLDTSAGIISALISTLKAYGLPVPAQSVLDSFIGPPLEDSFIRVYDLNTQDARKIAESFRELYKTDDYLLNATPYEGIFDLFDSLKRSGTKIGIATYKREDYAKQLLCKKGFNKYTDHMYGSDPDGKMKKSDIIRICLNNMGCTDIDRSVYIGDGVSDGKGANSLNMPFLAVTYGFGFKNPSDAEIYKPIGIAETCKDVREIIVGS